MKRLSSLGPAPPADPPRLFKVEVVVNVAAGGVGPGAADEVASLLAELGVAARVHAANPSDLETRLRASVDTAPDLLITLGGDGTARAAAEICGPDGPAIAPLPGGTMNLLSHAIYGLRPWPEALRLALANGQEIDLGGGRIEGRRFLCAAILGSPARLGPAREAARDQRFLAAITQLQRAVQRAFTGRLRYQLDGGAPEKAEALVLICPTTSKVMRGGEPVMEVAALNIHGAGELLRLGLNAIVRDWRVDPGVNDRFCRTARVWSAHRIPAILDGEAVILPGLTEVCYDPKVCRVLAPPKPAL